MSVVRAAYVLLICILSSVVYTQSCGTQSNGLPKLSCKICPSDDVSYKINDVKGLPRVNRQFESISTDMGDYDFYTCLNETSSTGVTTTSCDWRSPAASDVWNGNSNSRNPANWAQGFIPYVIFALVAALLSLFFGLFFGVFRYCCCCCCKGGTCGNRFPTKRTRCCGATQNAEGKWVYDKRERIGAFIFFYTFVFFAFLWMGLGYWNGSTQISSGAKSVLKDGPGQFVTTLTSTQAPVTNLLVNLASSTLVTMLKNVNYTIYQTIDFNVMYNKMSCVQTMINNFPDVNAIIAYINSAPSQINTFATTFQSQLATLTTQIQQHQNATSAYLTNSTLTPLNRISAATPATQQNATAENALLVQYDPFQTNVTQSSSGLSTTLASLTNFPTAQPNSSDITNLVSASSTYGSLYQVINRAVATGWMDASERATLLARVSQVQSKLNASPNLRSVKANIDMILSSIRNLNSSLTVPRLNTTTTRTKATLASYSALINTFVTNVQALPAYMNNLDFSPEFATIAQLNQTLYSPDFSYITNVINNQLIPLINQLPCLTTLTGFVSAINSTLFQLPSDASIVSTYSSQLTGPADQALSSLNLILASIQQFTNTRDNLTISQYIGQINTLKQNLVQTSTNLASNSVVQQLINVQTALANISFTVVDNIIAMKSVADSLSIANSDLQSLLNYDAYSTNVQSELSSVLSDLTAWSNGGGDVITCAINTGTTCASRSDAACPSGDRCLISTTRIQQLMNDLQNQTATNAATTSANTLKTSLTPLSTSVNAINTQPLEQNLQALGVLLSFPTPLSNFNSAANNVLSQFGTFDLSSLQSKFNNVLSQLNNINFGSATSPLNSLKSAQQSVIDQYSLFDRVQQLIRVFRDLLFTELDAQFFPRLSATNLRAIDNVDGPAGVLREVTQTFDSIVSFISSRQTIFNVSSTTTNTTNSIREKMSVLYNRAQYAQRGGLYTMMTLIQDTDVYAGPLMNRFDADINGQPYPDGKKCWTDFCLDNTVDYYYTNPLKDTSSLKVALSPLQIVSLPLVLTVLVVLIGALASLCCTCGKLSSCTASWGAGVAILIMTLYFIFSALLFPVMLGYSDFCLSKENLIFQYTSARANKLCSDVGGSGASTNCLITSYNNTELRLDLPTTVRNVFGNDCSNDAIKSSWNVLKSSIGTLPEDKVGEILDKQNQGGDPNSQFIVRPALRNTITTSASLASDSFRTFVDDMSSSISCPALAQIWASTKTSTCCKTGTALYWTCSCIYLLAFTIFFCGFPSLVCGRKRFHNQVWGPLTKDATIPPTEMPVGEQRVYASPSIASGASVTLADIELQNTTNSMYGGDASAPSGVAVPQSIAGPQPTLSPLPVADTSYVYEQPEPSAPPLSSQSPEGQSQEQPLQQQEEQAYPTLQ